MDLNFNAISIQHSFDTISQVDDPDLNFINSSVL